MEEKEIIKDPENERIVDIQLKKNMWQILKSNNILIDIDKEVEAMKQLGCLYFETKYNNAVLTIDLR